MSLVSVVLQACVWTPEEAIKSCQKIGYPVMLKASWGGGGKGIRKVHSDDEVRQVFKQIQGEVSNGCSCQHKVGTTACKGSALHAGMAKPC